MHVDLLPETLTLTLTLIVLVPVPRPRIAPNRHIRAYVPMSSDDNRNPILTGTHTSHDVRRSLGAARDVQESFRVGPWST